MSVDGMRQTGGTSCPGVQCACGGDAEGTRRPPCSSHLDRGPRRQHGVQAAPALGHLPQAPAPCPRQPRQPRARRRLLVLPPPQQAHQARRLPRVGQPPAQLQRPHEAAHGVLAAVLAGGQDLAGRGGEELWPCIRAPDYDTLLRDARRTVSCQRGGALRRKS